MKLGIWYVLRRASPSAGAGDASAAAVRPPQEDPHQEQKEAQAQGDEQVGHNVPRADGVAGRADRIDGHSLAGEQKLHHHRQAERTDRWYTPASSGVSTSRCSLVFTDCVLVVDRGEGTLVTYLILTITPH